MATLGHAHAKADGAAIVLQGFIQLGSEKVAVDGRHGLQLSMALEAIMAGEGAKVNAGRYPANKTGAADEAAPERGR
jgi:hypothetical protein